MTSPVKRQNRLPSPVAVVGGIVAVVVSFLVLRWVIGIAFTLIKVALVIAVIVAIVFAARKLFGSNKS